MKEKDVQHSFFCHLRRKKRLERDMREQKHHDQKPEVVFSTEQHTWERNSEEIDDIPHTVPDRHRRKL